jgi:hypothetical protein
MHRLKKMGLCALVALGAGAVATAAQAQDPAKPLPPASPADVQAPGSEGSLSLDPTTPQTTALPGGVTPAYGQKSQSDGEWRFDFHGFLTAPLAIGIGDRPMPQPGQSGTTLHTPPAVPDDRETFSHTGVVPTTYAQLNFSQGTSLVSAHMSILARQANASTSFLEPASQAGINDLYVSVLPKLERARTEIFVGAFSSRYGSPGEYDEGRYGTPLIARVNGIGQRISVRAPFGNWTVMAEEGLAGQSNKAGASVTPDVWNDFANPSEGTSFVAHGHAGARYARWATLGVHLVHAWSQDDRGNNTVVGAVPGSNTSQPDARLNVYVADLRVTAGRFGHLYLAGAYTDASNVTTLSRIVSVLNTRGGPGLITNYLGPNSNGNGNLTTIGWQYDLSIGKLISYPVPFSGDGPDLFVSLFGMITHVNSDDKQYDPNGRYYDAVTKRKFGGEVTYSLLSWLALSGRYDRVDPDTQDLKYSFSVVSPRVILRTDWLATDQIVLQYSHWFNGANTLIRVGDPPLENIAWVPDRDMVSLSASMWW